MKIPFQPLRSVADASGETNEEGQPRSNGTSLRGDQATERLAQFLAHTSRKESHANRPPATPSREEGKTRWYGSIHISGDVLAGLSP